MEHLVNPKDVSSHLNQALLPRTCTGCWGHCKPCWGERILQVPITVFSQKHHLDVTKCHMIWLSSNFFNFVCWLTKIGLVQAAVLLHLPGCQLCLHHQLHLRRILLVSTFTKKHFIFTWIPSRSTTLTCAQIFPVLSANASGRALKPKEAIAPAAEKPQERGFFRLVSPPSSF